MDGGRVVVECGGVGYEVMVPESVLIGLPSLGEEVTLHTRQIFREDGQSLVGFADPFERRFFDLLTDVKGCGPKVSLAIIGDLGAQTAFSAIATEDAKTLSKATGVGPRLAERMIVELREKVRQESLVLKLGHAAVRPSSPTRRSSDDELVEALMALGYRRNEAESAANDVPSDWTVEDKLREALRSLQR